MKSVRLVITGRVQGVWYRAWTTEEARRRGVSGWVRNCTDGSVEAVFSGAADVVDDMIAACHDGPPLARVAGIDVADCETPLEEGFTQLPTA